MGLTLRDYDEKLYPFDRGFVLSTWIRSYQASQTAENRWEKKRYLEFFPRVVERLIASPTTMCIIACSTDQPGTIHGWACGDKRGHVHWAYVAPELRKNGIARMCLDKIITDPKRVLISHVMPWQDDRAISEPYLLAM